MLLTSDNPYNIEMKKMHVKLLPQCLAYIKGLVNITKNDDDKDGYNGRDSKAGGGEKVMQ